MSELTPSPSRTASHHWQSFLDRISSMETGALLTQRLSVDRLSLPPQRLSLEESGSQGKGSFSIL